MKFLLTLAVLVIAVKWWLSRQRRPSRPATPPPPPPPPAAAPTPMCACAHCGLMLPEGEAWLDEQGRPFCGAEHRHLGPRV